MNEIVPVFKGIGTLPPANIVFSVADTPYLAQAAPMLGGICGIALYTALQREPAGHFKQTLAHELAHCLQTETFVEQNKVGTDVKAWREEGLAEYLSNVVYPENNLEWVLLYPLQQRELSTTVFDRSYENFLFFQYLGERLGIAGVKLLVNSLPGGENTGGRPDQEEARKEADLTFRGQGQLQDSSRPISEPSWGEIPTELLGDDCNPGVIVVVTTTEPNGGFELEVPEVREVAGGTPGDQVNCGIEGTWVVDNGSLDISPMAFTLDYISGQIRVTFRQDGVFELEYDNFEYRVSQEDDLNIGGIPVHRHEDFTYTTNASGTTTYEVDGNEITFGHFSESSYLEGTETRRQVRIFDPPSTLYPDIDEVTTRDASGLGLFGGFVEFEVQSNGSTLQWRFGDQVKATLSRAGAP